jgi:probable rRNA maturation factor
LKNVQNISFNLTENTIHPFKGQETHYKKWLNEIAASHGKSIKFINYIFCSDDYLLEINQKFLQHDDYTDIITFPYQIGNDHLESDIFISLERVKENADSFNVPFHEELKRVIAHGLLHLIGFEDKNASQTQEMRTKEEECILLFKTISSAE